MVAGVEEVLSPIHLSPVDHSSRALMSPVGRSFRVRMCQDIRSLRIQLTLEERLHRPPRCFRHVEMGRGWQVSAQCPK